jgi:hypothetical protein
LFRQPRLLRKDVKMGAVLGTSIEPPESLSLSPKLQQPHHGTRTRRIAELESIVQGLRLALDRAEEELEREKARPPAIGDFVRCPLTNFFGRVTKVAPRPQGRPWVEITPYLTKDLPGHGTMDLYDSWELIDPPDQAGPLPMSVPMSMPMPATKPGADRLPSVSSFAWSPKPSPDDQLADDIEHLLGELWTEPGKPAR